MFVDHYVDMHCCAVYSLALCQGCTVVPEREYGLVFVGQAYAQRTAELTCTSRVPDVAGPCMGMVLPRHPSIQIWAAVLEQKLSPVCFGNVRHMLQNPIR